MQSLRNNLAARKLGQGKKGKAAAPQATRNATAKSHRPNRPDKVLSRSEEKTGGSAAGNSQCDCKITPTEPPDKILSRSGEKTGGSAASNSQCDCKITPTEPPRQSPLSG